MRHCVPEVRAEYTNVVTASIPHANNRLRSCLIGNAKARREGVVIIFYIAVGADSTIAGDADCTRAGQIGDIGEAATTLSGNGFREVDFPPQSVIDGQPGRCPPSILPIKEEPLLPFPRGSNGWVIRVALELGDIAKDEGGQV